MPRQDPTPRQEMERSQLAWAKYLQLMRWMALAAFTAVLLALIYLKSTVANVPIHMVIATVAGVGLTVLLGTGLMGLVYFSNNSGHDEQAARSDNLDDRI